ncbi:hypothetical protein RND71_005648 [Anisodus tanguticus]|uniref:Uncharacterized protein n=1 Tax=Anisodus tanguticus TaxID=243964 RepID=A0AAE1SSJ8_9SOLA|nr:hypothetical protein RND71_005648 [Anisodus tanguticus]
MGGFPMKAPTNPRTLTRGIRSHEDGPDAAKRRPGSGFPTGRGTGDGHLKAHHDLQETSARPENANRLGVRGSIRIWICEGNRSYVPLTQLGNGSEGTATWGMSASRRKAHFSLWVIRRATLSDQGPGYKGPGSIQVRRTPEVTAMSKNLTCGPKRRANTRM